jgi:hypothetical protein
MGAGDRRVAAGSGDSLTCKDRDILEVSNLISSHLQFLTKTAVSVGYGTIVKLMQGERSVRDVWGVYASSPVKATPPRLVKCDMKREPSYSTRRHSKIVILQRCFRLECHVVMSYSERGPSPHSIP